MPQDDCRSCQMHDQRRGSEQVGDEHHQQAFGYVEDNRDQGWAESEYFKGVDRSCVFCAVFADIYFFEDSP